MGLANFRQILYLWPYTKPRRLPWGFRILAEIRVRRRLAIPAGQIGHACFGERRFSMISGYLKIVEQRIREAQEKGEFDDLAGHGKPLALEDDRHIPEDLRLAYKILKNAGCLPPEVEEKKA